MPPPLFPGLRQGLVRFRPDHKIPRVHIVGGRQAVRRRVTTDDPGPDFLFRFIQMVPGIAGLRPDGIQLMDEEPAHDAPVLRRITEEFRGERIDVLHPVDPRCPQGKVELQMVGALKVFSPLIRIRQSPQRNLRVGADRLLVGDRVSQADPGHKSPHS